MCVHTVASCSPVPESKWTFQMNLRPDGIGSTVFIATAGDDVLYAVTVMKQSGPMDSRGTEEFVTGMRKTFPKNWQIRDTKFEPSDIRVKDATRFRVTIGYQTGPHTTPTDTSLPGIAVTKPLHFRIRQRSRRHSCSSLGPYAFGPERQYTAACVSMGGNLSGVGDLRSRRGSEVRSAWSIEADT